MKKYYLIPSLIIFNLLFSILTCDAQLNVSYQKLKLVDFKPIASENETAFEDMLKQYEFIVDVNLDSTIYQVQFSVGVDETYSGLYQSNINIHQGNQQGTDLSFYTQRVHTHHFGTSFISADGSVYARLRFYNEGMELLHEITAMIQ